MQRLTFPILGLAVALSACADDAPPKTPADTVGDPTPQPAGDEDAKNIAEKDPSKSGITIGPKIMKLCDIPTANFAFDSAALGADAKAALDALAKCFVSGPAKGESMRVIGHADPRGEPEYNFGLGQKRAGSVADYLMSKGLEEDRIESSSRGELDATGTDEESWGKDRKVEILMAD